MYADAGLRLPAAFSQGCFFQDYSSSAVTNFYSVLPLFDDNFISSFCPGVADGGSSSVNMVVQAPTVSEYDMGGEGDLFKAAEPILEDHVLDLMTAAMPLMSSAGDITETIKAADIESIQNDRLSDIYYECKKDLLLGSEDPISDLDVVNLPPPLVPADEVPAPKTPLASAERSMKKSVSSGGLNSLEWASPGALRPDFLDFQGLDFEAAFGLRRAFSEGDIQNLGNKYTGKATAMCSSFEQLLSSGIKTEQRRQKLSRYREKKSKRNFGRKIKYACRKALADTQPRVRGRFAKTEDTNMSFQM